MVSQSMTTLVSAFFIALSVIPTIGADTNQERHLCSCQFDPENYPLLAREAWCTENIEACSILCSNHGTDGQPPNTSNIHINSCSPETLQYSCQCSDKSWPPLQDYFNSIPSRICIVSHSRCSINATYKFEDGELVMVDYGYGMVAKLKDRAEVEENMKYCEEELKANCPQALVPGMRRFTFVGPNGWLDDDYMNELIATIAPDEILGDEVKGEKATELVDDMEQIKSRCGALLKLSPRLKGQVLVFLALLAILAFVALVSWMKAIVERQRREVAEAEAIEEGYIQEKEKFSEKEIGSGMEK